MVSEVHLDDEESGSTVTTPSMSITQESAAQLQPLEEAPRVEETEAGPTPSDNLLEEVILEDGEEFEDPRSSDNYQLPPRRMVALFDYDPQTLSPNPDSEVRTAVDRTRFFYYFTYYWITSLVAGRKINPAMMRYFALTGSLFK